MVCSATTWELVSNFGTRVLLFGSGKRRYTSRIELANWQYYGGMTF